jgi:hypothetical protein
MEPIVFEQESSKRSKVAAADRAAFCTNINLALQAAYKIGIDRGVRA